MSPQLRTRLISAAVLIPCVLLILWLGGLVLAAALFLLYALAMREWIRLCSHYTLLWRKYACNICGGIYLAAAFLCLFDVAMHEPVLWGPLCIFISVWLSDTGAYITGKTIGGPKLAPKISPNKTWSGFAGACLAPAIGLFIYQIIYDYIFGYPHDIQQLSFVILALEYGIVIGIAGQAGDLLISKLKRRAGVKDTGGLIPGHGGLLDRIDSLILVSIIFWIWMQWDGYETLFHMQEGWRPIWHAYLTF